MAVFTADTTPKPIEIDPTLVKTNSEGFAFREIVVTVPTELPLADFNENATLFRKVQAHANVALRFLDHVTFVASDRSWLATAIVAAADADGVTLTNLHRFSFEPRSHVLPSSEKFEVRLFRGGYCVFNKAANVPTSSVFTSLAEAEKTMWAMHPKKAAN